MRVFPANWRPCSVVAAAAARNVGLSCRRRARLESDHLAHLEDREIHRDHEPADDNPQHGHD